MFFAGLFDGLIRYGHMPTCPPLSILVASPVPAYIFYLDSAGQIPLRGFHRADSVAWILGRRFCRAEMSGQLSSGRPHRADRAVQTTPGHRYPIGFILSHTRSEKTKGKTSFNPREAAAAASLLPGQEHWYGFCE